MKPLFAMILLTSFSANALTELERKTDTFVNGNVTQTQYFNIVDSTELEEVITSLSSVDGSATLEVDLDISEQKVTVTMDFPEKLENPVIVIDGVVFSKESELRDNFSIFYDTIYPLTVVKEMVLKSKSVRVLSQVTQSKYVEYKFDTRYLNEVSEK